MIPKNDKYPAIGIATNGKEFVAIVVNFPKAMKPLPDKSPNLETNVSIKTVYLYLSFFSKVVKMVSLVGLLIPYSKILSKTVTMPTEIIEGANP